MPSPSAQPFLRPSHAVICRSAAQTLCLALALTAGNVYAQDGAPETPRAWLERMNHAIEALNYRGTFVHDVDDGFETLSVVHRNDDGKVAERVWAREGAGREIVRHADVVRAILPDQRTVLLEERKVTTSLVAQFPSADVDLEPHYELSLGAVDRVADRTAQVVAISPRDELRYGYRLWLDQETAMPLRVQLIDGVGGVLEEIRFTEIEIGIEIPAEAVEPTIDTTGFTVQRAALPTRSGAERSPERNPERNVRARGLPTGFRVSSSMQMFVAGSDDPVDHFVISDGLATISVVVERHRDGGRSGSEESISNAAGNTLVYSARRGGNQVTAIGEAPPATLRSIALSLTNE